MGWTTEQDVRAILEKSRQRAAAVNPLAVNTTTKREDLKIFFGPNADVYLAAYDKTITYDRKWLATWHWPAFFFTFVWLFYRKLNFWAWVIIFGPALLAVLVPSASVVASTAMAIMAKSMYVQTGLTRIANADGLGLTGEERASYLREEGGVSQWAGFVAGTIFAILFVLSILGEIYGKR